MCKARDHFASTRANHIMSRGVVTLLANQNLGLAVQTLLDHAISGAPVVSDRGTCVGVFSHKDVPRSEGDEFDDSRVSTHMSSPAITVSEQHSLLDVVGIMNSSHIHRVPVVDNRARVVGIISTLDIIEQVARAMELEAPLKDH